MTALLRFTGGTVQAPAIDAWLHDQPSDLAALARPWLVRMRECSAHVRELMHDGLATFCIDDAPFAYIGSFKAHVSVGFFHGASLPDPSGLLLGAGKSMRHVKLKSDQAVNETALAALIEAAHRDIIARLRVAEVN
jgi:hypothetical protein